MSRAGRYQPERPPKTAGASIDPIISFWGGQVFGRRANVLKKESMPDPTKDDSILKLKKDKAFWAFVQTLPKK